MAVAFAQAQPQVAKKPSEHSGGRGEARVVVRPRPGQDPGGAARIGGGAGAGPGHALPQVAQVGQSRDRGVLCGHQSSGPGLLTRYLLQSDPAEKVDTNGLFRTLADYMANAKIEQELTVK